MATAEANDNLHTRLSRLCGQHTTAVHTMMDEQARAAEEALTECMAQLAKIESAADAEMQRAQDEYRKADPGGAQVGGGPAYWEYQKRINEIILDARQKAQTHRNEYVENWKALQSKYDELNHKARIDLLKRTQDAWRNVDLNALDAAGAETSAKALWAGFSQFPGR
jgi:DNA-binding FrmR family transcriptional regulator